MAKIPTKHPHKLRTALLWLLLLVVIIALGVLGYLFFYQNNAKRDNSTATTTAPPASQSPQQSTNSTTPPVASTQTFKIPELGAQMTLPDGLEGLRYNIDTSVQGLTLANFTTSTLVASSSSCTEGAIGSIALYYQTDPKAIHANVTDSRQVGKYYYAYIHPQSGCSTGSTSNLQAQQADQLHQAFATLVPMS